MNLSGKVAVVTGGAVGIGAAIVAELARQGAKVVINYHHSEIPAKELSESLRASGFETLPIQADVSEFAAAKLLVDKTVEAFGRIDILVNNAGITKDQLLMRMTEEDFDVVLKTNLKGTWNMIRLAAPVMSKQKYGRIVNISSVAGLAGNAGQANYASSKAGIIGLTKSVAREFARRNILANCVAPGFIETRMTGSLPPEVKEKILGEIPMNRCGTPEEVAKVVAFLAGDEAAYVTGQTLNVDGGMVMY